MLARRRENMYRIGEFSYLYQVTIKTLLHYDKKDLFKPSYKDPYTGYRYYSDSQRGEFENIMMLKELGFSLDEIKNLKDELTEEKMNEKIKELVAKRNELEGTIKKLEDLKNKDTKICDIGLTYNTKLPCVGRYISVNKRDKERIEDELEAISKILTKLKISHRTKVVITMEEGYKEENIDLFVGYRISLNNNEILKLRKKGPKLNLDFYSDPTSDYLVALNIKEDSDISSVCSKMIEYANNNNVQILGPFMEVYDDDGLRIYVNAEDLNRIDIIDEYKTEKRNKKLSEEFIPNVDIIGTWKIREILPNILFNPKKQKSIPDTKFEKIVFMENGKTNYDNLTYNDKYLVIDREGNKIYSLIKKFSIDDKEYLEIRMHDLMTVNKNAKPISYIYEKNNE